MSTQRCDSTTSSKIILSWKVQYLMTGGRNSMHTISANAFFLSYSATMPSIFQIFPEPLLLKLQATLWQNVQKEEQFGSKLGKTRTTKGDI